MIENAKKVYLKDKLKDADSKSMFRIVNGLLKIEPRLFHLRDALLDFKGGEQEVFVKKKLDPLKGKKKKKKT